MSVRVRRSDQKQRAKTARLWKKVKYYEWRAVSRNTAVFSEKNEGYKRDGTSSNGSGGGGGIRDKPGRECSRKKKGCVSVL